MPNAVGRNGNVAPCKAVEEACTLEVQSKSCKSMVPLIESIKNEKEPDWDSAKPVKEHVSFDPDTTGSIRGEMEVRLVRQQLEAQQGTVGVTTGSQGGQEESKTGEQPTGSLDEGMARMMNMVQKTCDEAESML